MVLSPDYLAQRENEFCWFRIQFIPNTHSQYQLLLLCSAKKTVSASLCFPCCHSKIFCTCLLDFVSLGLESSCETYRSHQWRASSNTFFTWSHIIALTICCTEYERFSNLCVVAAFEPGSFGTLQWEARKSLRSFWAVWETITIQARRETIRKQMRSRIQLLPLSIPNSCISICFNL